MEDRYESTEPYNLAGSGSAILANERVYRAGAGRLAERMCDLAVLARRFPEWVWWRPQRLQAATQERQVTAASLEFLLLQ